MDRSRRLYELWTWLVPFRVVAETESLPAAAELLRIAPSALSRSVKLLEDQLEVALFARRSHRLVLNDAGHRLLAAIRTAMRIIDDGVVDVIAALQRGLVDIAVVSSTAEAEGLVVRRVAGLSRGVFVAAVAATSNPVYAVPIDRDGAPRDGFPAQVPRAIGLRARQGAAVLEAVRSAGLAAVLPHAVGRRAGFVAVDAGVELSRLELSLATRIPVAAGDVVERVAERLIAALTGLA